MVLQPSCSDVWVRKSVMMEMTLSLSRGMDVPEGSLRMMDSGLMWPPMWSRRAPVVSGLPSAQLISCSHSSSSLCPRTNSMACGMSSSLSMMRCRARLALPMRPSRYTCSATMLCSSHTARADSRGINGAPAPPDPDNMSSSLPGGAYSAASTMARCACCGDSAVGSWAITAARYLHRDLRRRWAASCFLLLSPRAPLPSGVLLSSLAQFNSASCSASTTCAGGSVSTCRTSASNARSSLSSNKAATAAGPTTPPAAAAAAAVAASAPVCLGASSAAAPLPAGPAPASSSSNARGSLRFK
mmetsp:Transcript_21931/g.60692  ORF Transcript_21931/g.60692 Transcript_21931/m.60692 type:complete len:300 (-) Transcript_21931:1128-2027(-)